MKRYIQVMMVSMLLILSLPFLLSETLVVNAAPETKLYVSPSESRALPGDTVSIDIKVSDVVHLYAWEVILTWSPYDLFNYTGAGYIITIVEGSFLKQGGTTFLAKNIALPPTARVQVGSTLVGQVPGVNGSGTLATISIQVRKAGHSTLHISDTKLRAPDLTTTPPTMLPITHVARDGFFATDTPLASFTFSPASPTINQAITFNASTSRDVDGSITNYAWDFDDGTTSSETDPIAAHTYAAVGNFNVSLTVTDNASLTHMSWQMVAVARQASTLTLSANPTSVTLGGNVTLSGQLTPARVGITVTLKYRLVGETFATLGTTTTDSQSKYSYQWKPDSTGNYEVQASWAGDTTATPDDSDVQTVSVASAGIPMDLLIYAAVGIIIVIAVIGFILYRRRGSKPS